MKNEELRQNFLIENLFAPGEMRFILTDLDRALVGAVQPGRSALPLLCPEPLKANYLLERRELGILNIGGQGLVQCGSTHYRMDHMDCLYVGRGESSVTFSSERADEPALFYLLSYPAHRAYPTMLARASKLAGVQVGSKENCNERTIYKAIHAEGIKSCQLVMGWTELRAGSNWNTMPPHTHSRRSEIYFYFNLPATQRVVHLMGLPEETRSIMVADREIVLSPPWSIHCGAGTQSYSFCWGMGGENQDYADMDPVSIASLR